MRNRLLLISCALFVAVSFFLINPYLKEKEKRSRSSLLTKVTTELTNGTRTDYVNDNGVITYAADVGYATLISTNTETGKLEEYYDEEGNRIAKPEGNSGLLREYDEAGNNVKVTYLGDNGEPVLTSYGYAIEERTYTEEGRIKSVLYFDTDGVPICTTYYGYGKVNEYDEEGNVISITYVDASGKPMIAGVGYAITERTFYTEGRDIGKVEYEFYFDERGEPISLSVGQYGVHREYDENGENSVITYLDAEGNPIVTTQGYTTIVRGYSSHYTTEIYYDLNGNPYRLSEGQYGIKRQNGQTIYLDANGKHQINIKQFLYNNTWLIVVTGIIISAISVISNKRLNIVLLVLYICIIIYLTLLYRESAETGVKVELFWSYQQFLSDRGVRSEILKNIWLFIPFGTILYRLYPKKIVLLIPVLLSMLIELTQYVTGAGLCELDDVVSNSLGGGIGFCAGSVMTEILENTKRRRRKKTL